jgi:hypothetical protein
MSLDFYIRINFSEKRSLDFYLKIGAIFSEKNDEAIMLSVQANEYSYASD